MSVGGKRFVKNCTGGKCDNEKKETSRKVSRFIFYFLSLLFFVVFIYVLFFSPYLGVDKIQISGAQDLNPQDIEATVARSFSGKLLDIFPRNNFLLVSSRQLENSLANQYKKIRLVVVKKEFPDTVIISIDERKALLVWCSNSDSCFLIDENGIAYSEADFNSPQLSQNHLIKVVDQSHGLVNIGDQIMDNEFEQYLAQVGDSMKKLNISLDEEYMTPSRVSQEIDAKTDTGSLIYFSTQYPLENASKTLAIILKKELPKDQLNNVAYIDLRTENKVFYKLNGQQEITQQQDDSSVSNTDVNKKQEDKKK